MIAAASFIAIYFLRAPFPLIADHVPTMVGGNRVGWAYSVGYIKALYAAVKAESRRAK